MNEQLKRQMLDSYLRQQQQQYVQTPTPSVVSDAVRGHNTKGVDDMNTLVPYDGNPENITLAEFKQLVKRWLEFDNFIKKAREVIKEKRKQRDELTETITKFMHKYNIEDLNTKEGRIRCKTAVVKAPISQKVVKQRITDYFKDNENQRNEVLHKIYEEREQVEKLSLRRLKIT